MLGLETSNAPLSGEAKQALRMRRFLLAALTYFIAAALLSVTYALGVVGGFPTVAVLIAMVAINGALFVAFRSGLNQRFADPSLTKQQLVAAITLQMFIIYHLEASRGLALVFTFIIFLFGVFRLTQREFATLTLYALAAYALVLNLLMEFRPEAIANVHLEWLSWLLLAVVLPWFGMMGGQISELRNRLRARHLELSTAFVTIQKMATRDTLTGLHNRAALTEGLQHALALGERHGRRVALFFMDLDRFKSINDTHGHSAGDRVLREVAERLKRATRDSDIVARLGGDEFVVVAENFQSMADLEVIARKIVEVVGQPLQLDQGELPLSVSVGVAAAPQDGQDVPSLLRNGDAAMYRAKQRGRNGYAMYSSPTQEPATPQASPT